MLSVNFRSVRGMLGFFSVLLAAAMVLFPILIGILNFRESWLHTARDMEHALGMQADFIRKWFVFHQNAVRSISRLSSVSSRDYPRMLMDFSNFARANANFDTILYVDNLGKPVVENLSGEPGTSPLSVADRPYFKAAAEGKEHISGILQGRSTGKPIIIVSVPLTGEDGFEGLVFGSVSLDTLLSILRTTPFRVS